MALIRLFLSCYVSWLGRDGLISRQGELFPMLLLSLS